MTDMSGAPLDEDVRALVESTRAAPVVPADSRARVLARVELAVFPPGGGGGGGGVDSGRHWGHGAVSSQAGWVRRALPLAASFILGGVVGAAAMRGSMRPPARAVSAGMPHDAPNLEEVIEPSASNARASTTETPALVTPTSPVGPPAPLHAHEARGAPSPVLQTGLAAERALLDTARGALEREEGAAALAATSEHERRFPDGILAQEREAMAVRALAMLGRMDEARARADRFHARFPGSALIPALESSIGSASKSK
jgi:hypothetical protein